MKAFTSRGIASKLEFKQESFVICTNYEHLATDNFMPFTIESNAKLDVEVIISFRTVGFDQYGMRLEIPFEIGKTFTPSCVFENEVVLLEELQPGKYAIMCGNPIIVELEKPSHTLRSEIRNLTEIEDLKVHLIVPPMAVLDRFVHEGGETNRSVVINEKFNKTTLCSTSFVIQPHSEGELVIAYDVMSRNNLKM